MRASIREVGERAGVSRMTVSRVLSGRGGTVSDEARARVLQAVRELNYVPISGPASQRRHVETRTLGLVFDEVEVAEDIYGLMTLRGLRQGALRHGYDLLMMLRPKPDWAPDRDEVRFLDRRCDGFIFIAPHERTDVLKALVAQHIPVVSCHKTDVPRGVAHVAFDNFAATQIAVRHLVEMGHRRIAHISGFDYLSYFELRRSGFRHAMRDAKLSDEHVLQVETYGDQPDDVLLQELKRRAITAVVCYNDYYALALKKFVESRGVRVPQELSIVGLDGVPEAREAGLTSVEGDSAGIGSEALDALIGLLQGRAWDECCRKWPPQLVERDSVAPHKSTP